MGNALSSGKLKFWLAVWAEPEGRGQRPPSVYVLRVQSHGKHLASTPPPPKRSKRSAGRFPFMSLFHPCREHSREVDARSQTLLSQRAHHPRGQQEGPEKWRAHTQGAGQDETGASARALSLTFSFQNSGTLFLGSFLSLCLSFL